MYDHHYVTFIRHGESIGNVDASYYSHHDSCVILTQKGVDQCLELSKKIHHSIPHNFAGNSLTVFASRYTRAQLTANIVMSKLRRGIDVVDPRINEQITDHDGIAVETPESVRARVRSLVEQNPFHLLLFTHGMLMGCVDPAKGGARNCEVRSYERNQLLEMLK